MAAFFADLLENPVNLVATLISVVVVLAGLIYLVTNPKMVLLAVKNLRRNLVRTLLTSAAVMVLVMMVTLIWTVVYFLDVATTGKAANFKVIVTERWQIPSQMPLTHARYLDPESSVVPAAFWQPGEPTPLSISRGGCPSRLRFSRRFSSPIRRSFRAWPWARPPLFWAAFCRRGRQGRSRFRKCSRR